MQVDTTTTDSLPKGIKALSDAYVQTLIEHLGYEASMEDFKVALTAAKKKLGDAL